jgi:hypothetical protein
MIHEKHEKTQKKHNKKFLQGGPGGAVFSKSAPPGRRRFGLIAEHPPTNSIRAGTANLVRTFCSSPSHPFCAAVGTDHAGPNPIKGPWESVPSLSLFRPRSIFPKLRIGLGLLDNAAFRMQNGRVVRFLEAHGVQRQFILIANNPRFASFAANLPCAVPRDVYIVDDFVADSGIYQVKHEVAQQVLDRLVMESERVFTISPVYASDLEAHYGRSCEFLPIPVPDSLLDTIKSGPLPNKESSRASNDVITFHHSGQIHHLYTDALISLIGIFREIAETKKIKIRLELWGNITAGDAEKALRINLQEVNLKDNFQIKICGEVPPLELARQQKRADFLLLVNSFLPEIERQVRCSFSSKICEYMVSGVPILVYAPAYSSLVAHLGKYKAAHIMTSQDMEELRLQLEEILVNPQKDRTVEAAKNLALDIHSSKSFFDRITGNK